VKAALADLADRVESGEAQAQDWLRTWREQRSVVPLPDGWSIAPPWLVDQTPDPARTVVIDPGLAFGAGDHPTTRDSATLVLAWVRPGDRVLDLGAGSGVLSILALKAGAATATAVEIDAMAAGEIPRNAALNDVTGITAIQADATQAALGESFDLLLLNIGARESRLLQPLCDRVAAPGARLILSGLADWAAPAVAEVYTAAGWRTRQRLQAGSEWVTLAMTRR
jgi:ribosomal protein L11 methyltransferase